MYRIALFFVQWMSARVRWRVFHYFGWYEKKFRLIVLFVYPQFFFFHYTAGFREKNALKKECVCDVFFIVGSDGLDWINWLCIIGRWYLLYCENFYKSWIEKKVRFKILICYILDFFLFGNRTFSLDQWFGKRIFVL
jgi:hypothetical protein